MKVKEQFIDTKTLMEAKDEHQFLEILYELQYAFVVRNGCKANHIFLSVPVQNKLMAVFISYISYITPVTRKREIMGLTIMTSPNDTNFVALL